MFNVVFTALILSSMSFLWYSINDKPEFYRYDTEEDIKRKKKEIEEFEKWSYCSKWFTILFALWLASLMN